MMYELQSRLGQALGMHPAVASGASLVAKATILFLIAALAVRVIRQAPAAHRHLVLSAGLIAALLLPVLSAVVPDWRVALLPATSWSTDRAALATTSTSPMLAAVDGPALRAEPALSGQAPAVAAPQATVALPSAGVLSVRESGSAGAVVATSSARPAIVTAPNTLSIVGEQPPPTFGVPALSLELLLAGVWLIGAVLSLVPWTVGLFVRRQFARQSSARLPDAWAETMREVRAETTLPSRVRVMATTATSMPMTWGVLRPVVLVPRDVAWSRDERRAAILHELAHVRRWDSLTQLIGRVTCALYWFNPFAWMVVRAERLAREEACDDAVLRSGARASAYAEQLLGVARSSMQIPLPVAALTMARRSNLAERLRAILDPDRDRSGTGRRARRATLLAATLVLAPLAAFTPVPEAAGQSATTATTRTAAARVRQARTTTTVARAAAVAEATTLTRAAEASVASVDHGPLALGSEPTLATTMSPAAASTVAAATPSATVRADSDAIATLAHTAPYGSATATVVSAALPSPTAGSVATIAAPRITSTPSGTGSFAAAFTALASGDWTSSLIDRAKAAASSLIPPLTQRQSTECSRTGKKGSRSHSSWSTSDGDAPESRRWQVKWNDGDCRMELDARGTFTLTPNADDIASITRGGRFDLLDATVEPERRIRIVPAAGGELTREYWVDGTRTAYDAEAAAWFAKALIMLDRRTAFAVDARLPLLLQRGGVDAVVAEAALMSGDYPRRVYFTKLLVRRTVTADELARVLDGAATSFESDYEKAELLVAIAKQRSFDDNVHLPFAKMAGSIKSGYERRRALSALLKRDDLRPQVVAAVLAAADGMDSDYELAELLISVSRRYAIDASTRTYYLKSLTSLQSDYEHRRVLDALVKGGDLTPSIAEFLLTDARRLQSDYELTEFLMNMASAARANETVFKAYLSTVSSIESDYEHHRALSALVKRKDLPASSLRLVVESARALGSEYERASLLVEVAEGRELTGDLLDAYLDVAATLKSEHERNRALAAVPRARASRIKL